MPSCRYTPAANRGLKVETDERQFAGDGAAVLEDGAFIVARPGAEAQEAGVVTVPRGELRLGAGLRGAPAEAGDERERPR